LPLSRKFKNSNDKTKISEENKSGVFDATSYYNLSTIFSFCLLFAEQPSGDSDGHAYLELANRVFDTALSEGQAYAMLRELCLDIGPRLSGSPQAAAAVEWGRQTMQRAGLEHVYLQPV